MNEVREAFLEYHQSNEPHAFQQLEASIADARSAITQTEMLSINAYLREKMGIDAYAPPVQFGESLMNDLRMIVGVGDVPVVSPDAYEAAQKLIEGIENWASDIRQNRIGPVSVEFAFLCTPVRAWSEVASSTIATIEELKLDYEFSANRMNAGTEQAVGRISDAVSEYIKEHSKALG